MSAGADRWLHDAQASAHEAAASACNGLRVLQTELAELEAHATWQSVLGEQILRETKAAIAKLRSAETNLAAIRDVLDRLHAAG